MAEQDDEMQGEPVGGKKKGRGRLFLIILILLILGGGGAGGFLYFQKGAAAKTKGDSKSKSKKSKSAGEDGDSAKDDAAPGEEKAGADQNALDLPKDEAVKKVIEIQPFILNLADKEENRFLRLSLSLGIGEEGSEKPDAVFVTRVRNAVLSVLMTKTSNDVLSAEGKVSLRKELLSAIRAAVEEPHVEVVYITELIVQR